MTRLSVLCLCDQGTYSTIQNLPSHDENLSWDNPMRALDLEEAKAILQDPTTQPYDVCCIDQDEAPGEDRLSDIRELRSLSPQTVMIVFINQNNPEARSRAYEAGAHYVLSKPVNAKEVGITLTQLLEQRTVRYESQLAAFVDEAYQTRTMQQVGHLIVQYGRQLGFRRTRLYQYLERGQGALLGVAESDNQGLPPEKFYNFLDPLDGTDSRYIEQVVRTKQLCFFPGRKPDESALDRAFAPYNFKPPLGAWVELPLLLDGELWGTLTLDCDQKEPDLHVLHALRPTLNLFSRLASNAIKRAREKKNSSAKQASRVAAAIEATSSLDEIVYAVLNQLRKLFADLQVSPFVLIYCNDAEHGYTLQFTDQSLKCFYNIDVPGEKNRKHVRMDEKSLVTKVAHDSIASTEIAFANVGDVSQGEQNQPYLQLIQDTKSKLCFTLMSAKKSLLGVIALESPMPNAFTQEDMEVLRLLAGAISKAIQRTNINVTNKILWPEGYSSEAVVRYFFPKDVSVPTDEVDSLLQCLFPTAKLLIAVHPYVHPKDPRPAQKQFPGHDLVKLTVHEDKRSAILVKIGLRTQIDDEFKRYRKYIENTN